MEIKFERDFLATRSEAKAAFTDIDDRSYCVINFKGVDLISPSFAHELVLHIKKKNLSFCIINYNKIISKLIELNIRK